MKLWPMLLAAAMLPAVAAPMDTSKTSWPDLTRSADPADKKLVAEIERMEWYDVCVAWGRDARLGKNARRMYAMQNFLMTKAIINGLDLGGVRGKRPQIGMTACGVFATMGTPDSVNNTQTATRIHAQLVYRDRHVYVYTDGTDGNGVVTSIQF